MSISTHVLDLALGAPARGVPVRLYRIEAGERTVLTSARTNEDGRTVEPLATDDLAAGTYEITFEVAAYFAGLQRPAFYDEIAVRFRVGDGAEHYHIPLLLAPWGYSTYRGT